ncbi:GGDEF domain-containing protein [Vibrio sinensis]|uniref:diguanylate cyclase n=1 Tax=Vibrio sinensis TaxID=2302434 RepID=A0A3A6QT38_9VIBR|nr:GGDEF domain-containing protein [Vibrio sinensis]RJX71506.1 GGDEF domain-containing protein [Vibrio sinensis]
MTDDDFKKSTANLKKAVPLMMKNHVAATPANYALWYTYVDNTIPKLNKELDGVINSYGICPPSASDQLYNTHLASRNETKLSELKASVEVLVNEVANSMSDTITGTSKFSAMIDKTFDSLERVEGETMSLDDVMGVVRQLVSESREIRHSTQFLTNQLTKASDEIGKLKSELADVQKDALFDSLSGLYNRRSFDADVNTLCRSNQAFCLIIADIDHFKSYNDTYGHLFGDSIIKGLARRLMNSCREGCTAYRIGGEEFAIVIPNRNIRIARQFADSLRRAIEKLSIKDRRSGEQVGNITASFGVAEFREGDTLNDVLDRADSLLYEAKQLGRNRVMPL